MNEKNQATPDYATKSRFHLGVWGQIVRWNAERACGFVQTKEPPAEIFFHAKVLQANEIEPEIGEKVQIRALYDYNKKRWTASAITSPQREQAEKARLKAENALLRPMKDKLMWAIPLILIWLALLAFLAWQLAAISTLVSGVAMILYAWDKHCATHERSRIPENALHAVALLGGWTGALLARYLFRHKTQKQPFVGIFWGTVVLNVAAVGYLIFSGSLEGLG